MLGIAVGVTALIAVISVMNGFEQELRTRILGMVAHATVEVGESIANWRDVVARAGINRRVLGAAPTHRTRGHAAGERVWPGAGARHRAGTGGQGVRGRPGKLIAGSMDGLRAGAFGIVLGKGAGLSPRRGRRRGVWWSMRRNSAPRRWAQCRASNASHVVGIFEAGMEEYDAGLAVVHLEDAASARYRMDGPGGVRLKLDDMFAAFAVARETGGRSRRRLPRATGWPDTATSSAPWRWKSA